MIEDGLLGAAGVGKGVGKAREPIEGPLLVGGSRQDDNVCRPPAGVNYDIAKRVAE
jgi:hypothetical protein